MKRINIHQIAIAAMLLILTAVFQPAMAEKGRPLNYLIILGDDISASTLGCYGALNPHTSPNIDKLASQLFDLNADRWEMNNLAKNPEYQSKVQALKAAITAWMKQQGDDGHLKGEGIKYAETAFAD
jgi:arylsulfatase A-like enzyme